MFKNKPDPVLIVSVLVACLFVAGAIVFATMKRAQTDTNMTVQVASVPASLRLCAKGDSCLMVDITCDQCHQYVAINSHQEDVFTQIYNQSCEGFRGKSCPPEDPKVYPSCVKGNCILLRLP